MPNHSQLDAAKQLRFLPAAEFGRYAVQKAVYSILANYHIVTIGAEAECF